MKKKNNKKDSILVICAHSDDQIFGPGGTITKYAKEGKKVYTIIFSYGVSSHIWYKEKVTTKIRVKEAKEADKIIGGKGITFLALNELKFIEEFKKRKISSKLEKIILNKRPAKIFTHSPNDPLPDHRAVYKLVTETYDKIHYKCDVYTFDVWNPINIKIRNLPKMYVDITDTFKVKLEALKKFPSQKIAMISLLWSVYIRAIFNGLENNCRFAERFFKVR